MTLNDFINDSRSLLEAPAGHGKTHAIAECLSLCPDNQCQLILTHTHAGIASLKIKMSELKINHKKYHMETITSFAQKYVLAYCSESDLPDQSDKDYFGVIVKKAIKLFSYSAIIDIIKISYNGLFVDEYQDCDISQHDMILKLASVLPTHLLGDELQGIFTFSGETIKFDNHLADFTKYDFLQKPWRWINKGNPELGNKILEYRNILKRNNETVILTSVPQAHFYVVESYYELNDNNPFYYKQLRNKIKNYNCESILIIFPSYTDSRGILRGQVGERALQKKRFDFENHFQLIEAIDSREFYSNAMAIDNFLANIHRARKKEKNLYDILVGLTFNKTDLNKWFDIKEGKCRIKDKRGESKVLSIKLREICNNIIDNPSKTNILELILFFMKELRLIPKRVELPNTILRCLQNDPENNISVYKSMQNMKNRIRRSGRKIHGKCIGTTLLTKGLEFDTVIILDAHRFEDSKNFYVAISRACKNLIIFTKHNQITFTR